jgi:hypothetical protein
VRGIWVVFIIAEVADRTVREEKWWNWQNLLFGFSDHFNPLARNSITDEPVGTRPIGARRNIPFYL